MDKVCNLCNHTKDSTEFSPKRGTCKECRNKLYKAYYAANQDSCRLTDKTYQQAHKMDTKIYNSKYRAKKAKVPSSLTLSKWLVILAEYQFCCLCCKKPMLPVELTIDHIVPLEHLGHNTPSNVQPLCIECNKQKGIEHTDYRGV